MRLPIWLALEILGLSLGDGRIQFRLNNLSFRIGHPLQKLLKFTFGIGSEEHPQRAKRILGV